MRGFYDPTLFSASSVCEYGDVSFWAYDTFCIFNNGWPINVVDPNNRIVMVFSCVVLLNVLKHLNDLRYPGSCCARPTRFVSFNCGQNFLYLVYLFQGEGLVSHHFHAILQNWTSSYQLSRLLVSCVIPIFCLFANPEVVFCNRYHYGSNQISDVASTQWI